MSMSSFAGYPNYSYHCTGFSYRRLKSKRFFEALILSHWKQSISSRNFATTLSSSIFLTIWAGAITLYLLDLLVQERLGKAGDRKFIASGVANSLCLKGMDSAGWGSRLKLPNRFLHHIRTQTNDKIVLISNYTQTLDLFEKHCRSKKCGLCSSQLFSSALIRR